MGEPVLKIEGLCVTYTLSSGPLRAVRELSLTVNEGESLGIMGESGSGKSSLAAAVMGCLSPNCTVSGRIIYRGVDLLSLSAAEFEKYRWRDIAMVFQNSLDVLNPVLTIGEQIGECIRKHMGLKGQDCAARVERLLREVQLPPETAEMLPHQLSGGMRQRALIAMAVSCSPRLLIADEPSSAVDEENKREIRRLLCRLKESLGLTLIIISHEIPTVAASAERVAVMYGGCLMEYGQLGEILYHSRHSYTRGLLASSPSMNPYRDLWGIAEEDGSTAPEGCPFYGRCPQRQADCRLSQPAALELEGYPGHYIACHRGGIKPLLTVSRVSKSYSGRGGQVSACTDCSFRLFQGEVISLLGKSGAGKSTLAMICAGMERADSGSVHFMGEDVSGGKMTCRPGGIQIIMQDPFSSLNGRMSVLSAVTEPLRVQRRGEDLAARGAELLRDVGLPWDGDFLSRPCGTLSGGQRQRLSVARALSMEPRLLIADEICSMLDSSTQANLLRLLKTLQQKRGMGLLFVTHDELLSRKIADRTLRIDGGVLTECNGTIYDGV